MQLSPLSFLPTGLLLTPRARAHRQQSSRGGWGGRWEVRRVSITRTVSQGHLSPPVEAGAICTDGTNAATDITRSGSHSFLFREGGGGGGGGWLFLSWRLGHVVNVIMQ